MNAMICQPMGNKTNKQIAKEREDLVKELENEGFNVLNTIIDEDGEGNDFAIRMLAKSLEFMSFADVVIFMPGWEEARGCRIEHEVAVKYGKFVKELR